MSCALRSIVTYIVPVLGGIAALFIIKDELISWFKPKPWTAHQEHHRITKTTKTLEQKGYACQYCFEREFPRKKTEGWKLVTVIIKRKRFYFYVPSVGWLIKKRKSG